VRALLIQVLGTGRGPARMIVMVGTSEYCLSWTVADQADQPSLPPIFGVAATCRFD